MKRSKKGTRPAQEAGTSSTNFWPVPGIDGEPYPPLVQEALDLVAAETKRRKIQECAHEGRYPATGYTTGYYSSEEYHVCKCRTCGADRIKCLPSDECDPVIREARTRLGLRTLSYEFDYARQDPPRPAEREKTETALPIGFDYTYERTRVDELRQEALRLVTKDKGALRRSIVYNAMGHPVLTWDEPELY